MSGRTVVINTAITVLVSLQVSSIGTNFFSSDEVARRRPNSGHSPWRHGSLLSQSLWHCRT